MRAQIEAREGVCISRSQLSKALQQKFRSRRPRHTLKGRQVASEVDRIGLRLQLREQQAKAGDIVLLYGDASEALTHPYLARAWAKSGADLRVPAPGQAKKVAMPGSLNHVTHELIVQPVRPGAAPTSWRTSSRSMLFMARCPAKRASRWCWSKTMDRSTSASFHVPPCRPRALADC
jgi:hypothetical protein